MNNTHHIMTPTQHRQTTHNKPLYIYKTTTYSILTTHTKHNELCKQTHTKKAKQNTAHHYKQNKHITNQTTANHVKSNKHNTNTKQTQNKDKQSTPNHYTA